MSLSSVTGGAPGGRHSATKWVGTTAAVLIAWGIAYSSPSRLLIQVNTKVPLQTSQAKTCAH